MIELNPLEWDLIRLSCPIPPSLPEAVGYAPQCPARYWSFWYEGFSDGNWSAGGAATDAHAFLIWWRHPAVMLSKACHLLLGSDDEPQPFHKIVVDLAAIPSADGLPCWWGEADKVEGFLGRQHVRPIELQESHPISPEEWAEIERSMRRFAQERFTIEDLDGLSRARVARHQQLQAWLDATPAFKAAQATLALIARREGL